MTEQSVAKELLDLVQDSIEELDAATLTKGDGLKKPPTQSMWLFDFFSGNDISAKTNRYERESAGAPDPERSLINSGRIGFKQRTESDRLARLERTIIHEGGDAPNRVRLERAMRPERVSKAQLHRERAAIMDQLSREHYRALGLAFGPQDIVPFLKMQAHVAIPPKGDADKMALRKEALEVVAWNEKRKPLGRWRQLLPETLALQEAFAGWQAAQREAAKPNAVTVERRAWRLETAEAVFDGICSAVSENNRAIANLRDLVVELRSKAAAEKREIGIVTKDTEVALAHAQRDRDAAKERAVELRQELSKAEREREAAHVDEPGVKRPADTQLVVWIVQHATTKPFAKALDMGKLQAFVAVRAAWNALINVPGFKRRMQDEIYEREAETMPWD